MDSLVLFDERLTMVSEYFIYDEEISVTPLFKIRENEKFSGIEALKSQIEKDKTVMESWIE
jgi:FAD synthase